MVGAHQRRNGSRLLGRQQFRENCCCHFANERITPFVGVASGVLAHGRDGQQSLKRASAAAQESGKGVAERDEIGRHRWAGAQESCEKLEPLKARDLFDLGASP
jgi:hypothetical protein